MRDLYENFIVVEESDNTMDGKAPDEETPIVPHEEGESRGAEMIFTKYVGPCLAECTAVFIFVWIGVMSSVNESVLAVAAAHGLTIAFLVTAFGKISGGHINPAVTLGVTLGGGCSWLTGFAYVVSQLLGSILGAVFAKICTNITIEAKGVILYDTIKGGTPQLAKGIHPAMGVAIETILTFILVLTVLMAAVDQDSPIAPMAIGLVVLVDILAGGNFTGGCMNPARSFGPAVISGFWDNEWVYWAGPALGSLVAAVMYRIVFAKPEKRVIFKSKEA